MDSTENKIEMDVNDVENIKSEDNNNLKTNENTSLNNQRQFFFKNSFSTKSTSSSSP